MTKLRIISGEEVEKKEIRQALELDKNVYDSCYHLNIETCYSYLDKNKEIYIMCQSENGQIVGYINFTPISNEFYLGLRSGSLIDTDLTSIDIMTYDDKTSRYNGYISSIIVREDYRGKGISKLLLQKLMSKIVELNDRGIYFQRLILDAVSENGQILAGKLGFNKIGSTQHDSVVYEAILLPCEWKETEYNRLAQRVYAKNSI